MHVENCLYPSNINRPQFKHNMPRSIIFGCNIIGITCCCYFIYSFPFCLNFYYFIRAQVLPEGDFAQQDVGVYQELEFQLVSFLVSSCNKYIRQLKKLIQQVFPLTPGRIKIIQTWHFKNQFRQKSGLQISNKTESVKN